MDALLAVDLPGVTELRVQARTASANSDGLIIGLHVDPSIPTPAVSSGTPVEAIVDGSGHRGA